MELIDEICAACAETLLRRSRCRLPLNFTSKISAEIFERWRIICKRRMNLSTWELIPPRDPPPRYLRGNRILVGELQREIWKGFVVARRDPNW